MATVTARHQTSRDAISGDTCSCKCHAEQTAAARSARRLNASSEPFRSARRSNPHSPEAAGKSGSDPDFVPAANLNGERRLGVLSHR